jgi:hypothetical protein
MPETHYGHLIYLNEEGVGVFDKSTYTVPALTSTPSCGLIINEEQTKLIPKISTPHFVAINFNNHGYILEMDQTGTLAQVDCTGKLLNSKLGFYDTNRLEVPRQLICTKEDGVLVITDQTVYEFDSNLNLLNSYPESFSETSLAAYSYNPNFDTWELRKKDGVLDLKYNKEDEWYISADDYNLYKNGELFASFEDKARSFAIDPKNRLWVMHGMGAISVFKDEKTETMAPEFVVNFQNEILSKRNNISFFCRYNRKTKQRDWRVVVHYSEGHNIFLLNLDGEVTKNIEKYPLFNTSLVVALKQDSLAFEFASKGDFTGYEHKRVFSELSPYKGKPQIVLKAALKNKTAFDLKFDHIKSQNILELAANSHQNFILTHKKQEFVLYRNTIPIITLPYTGKYELDYILQPAFYIGVSKGNKLSLNSEVGHNTSTFNGTIADVKMFDYAINSDKLDIFLRKFYKGEDLYWSLPIPFTQYIERIDRVFQNKIPGFKSPFYEIKLSGDKIKDPHLRKIIENKVREIVNEFQPATAELLRVKWLE